MQSSPNDAPATAVVEAYGARLAVSAPDHDILGQLIQSLPRGWEVCDPGVPESEVEWRFAVLRDENGYRIRDGDGHERVSADLALAIWTLRTEMRRYIGHRADDFIFVHAGVVSHQGRAIMLPGPSLAGKSTLVAALVDAGATFYSDEYAMLDRQGLVAQYREPLSLRGREGRQEVTIGSEAVQRPIPVGIEALAVYRPGATWSPERLSPAAGVLATMEHAVPARDRPAETMKTLRLALEGALIFKGERGSADETAKALLKALAELHV